MKLLSNFFNNKNKSGLQNNQNNISKQIQNVIDNFSKLIGCGCTIIPKNTSNEKLTQIFLSELENGKKIGYFPIILSSEQIFIQDIEEKYNSECENFHEKILNNIDVLQGEEFLKSTLTTLLSNNSEDNDDIYGQSYVDIKKNPKLYKELHNPFNSLHNSDEFEIFLAKIPTDKPWKIFAWIPFGGWNECPHPENIMSVSKYWYEKHGAIPAVITSDSIQFYVLDPIKEFEDALHVAEEHFAFCPDSVFQGAETINALSSLIIESSIWDFWWD